MNGSFCLTIMDPVSDGLSFSRMLGSLRMASATRTAASMIVGLIAGASFAVSANRSFVVFGYESASRNAMGLRMESTCSGVNPRLAAFFRSQALYRSMDWNPACPSAPEMALRTPRSRLFPEMACAFSSMMIPPVSVVPLSASL